MQKVYSFRGDGTGAKKSKYQRKLNYLAKKAEAKAEMNIIVKII